MRVLITGANGFVGRNLQLRLRERKDVQVVCYTRDRQAGQLAELLEGVDFVFHLAGVNRPQDPKEFTTGNTDLTRDLCLAVASVARLAGKPIPILYTSSSQAVLDNAYGRSKREAEEALAATGRDPLVPVHVFRLPNVFGKWCRPNYNSAVATFCHNIARDLPIQVNDPQARLTLVYIDDVIERFVQLMDGAAPMAGPDGFAAVQPQYATTVGELARLIRAFHDSRGSLVTERVGTGLVRALYATYVSYLPVEAFVYDVPQHADRRGVFVEMLKTPDCGQFSFFTAYPGVTRGGHYHHSKTEKFLVIKGQALFRFRRMQTGQTHEVQTSGEKPQIVETVPGWTHDITNTGSEEMVVMLWANEIFDRARPDTYDCPLQT
jgi:UDP-2-acetamido-2,6-beta-L-arabino-hexul-4-ose reductase